MARSTAASAGGWRAPISPVRPSSKGPATSISATAIPINFFTANPREAPELLFRLISLMASSHGGTVALRMDTVLYVIAAALIAAGLVGAIVPALPGIPLIFGGIWLIVGVDHYRHLGLW